MIRIAKPIIDNEYAYDFDAHALDSTVGLHYEPARHYDPTIGRWLSDEAIGFEADANLYRYVGNRPE